MTTLNTEDPWERSSSSRYGIPYTRDGFPLITSILMNSDPTWQPRCGVTVVADESIADGSISILTLRECRRGKAMVGELQRREYPRRSPWGREAYVSRMNGSSENIFLGTVDAVVEPGPLYQLTLETVLKVTAWLTTDPDGTEVKFEMSCREFCGARWMFRHFSGKGIPPEDWGLFIEGTLLRSMDEDRRQLAYWNLTGTAA